MGAAQKAQEECRLARVTAKEFSPSFQHRGNGQSAAAMAAVVAAERHTPPSPGRVDVHRPPTKRASACCLGYQALGCSGAPSGLFGPEGDPLARPPALSHILLSQWGGETRQMLKSIFCLSLPLMADIPSFSSVPSLHHSVLPAASASVHILLMTG